jgi:hypothetical protein
MSALLALSPHQSPVPHTPDFLWSFVGSLNFMRLSLKRAAHAVLSRAAYRKFGASRSFFARCGIPQASPSSLLDGPTDLHGCPTFAPALPGFPPTPHWPRPRVRLSLKESRMKLLNATNLDRKSGIRGPKTMGEALRQPFCRTQPVVHFMDDYQQARVGAQLLRRAVAQAQHRRTYPAERRPRRGGCGVQPDWGQPGQQC